MVPGGILTALSVSATPSLPSSSTAQSSDPPNNFNPAVVAPKQKTPNLLVDLETAAAQASKEQGIPIDEIRRSMKESKAIIDAIARYKLDPAFGSIWVTYQPYVVHLRLAFPDQTIVATVSAAVGEPLDVTTTGLSAVGLADLEKKLVSHLSKQPAEFEAELDVKAGGYIARTLNERALTDFSNADVRLEVAAPTRSTSVTGYGGLPIYVYTGSIWDGYCTGGFMMRNPSTGEGGILTAGHCPYYDGRTHWYNGETPTGAVNRTCGNGWGDGEIMPFSGSTSYLTFTNSSISEYVSMRELGGYFINQEVRQGRRGLGDPGGNSGIIAAYISNQNIHLKTPTSCPSDYTLSNAFRVDVQSTGGDSGGPLVASYGGYWFGLAITTASTEGSGQTFYSPWWSLNTSGWNYCQEQYGC